MGDLDEVFTTQQFRAGLGIGKATLATAAEMPVVSQGLCGRQPAQRLKMN